MNVTSTEGLSSAPGISIYGSSKFALEGVYEGLFSELAPFGIRVLLIEPGGMRTSFLDPNNASLAEISEPYKGGIVDHVLNAVMQTHGQQMLDPERSAQRIVENVSGGGEGWPENREQYLRLPLGKEVQGRINGKIALLQKDMDAMKDISNSVDFDA
jgi:NAD(P)-dependent dehydrogenase (short-subunit alcohol dehydrogenase family)